jgi:hypothetical protein
VKDVDTNGGRIHLVAASPDGSTGGPTGGAAVGGYLTTYAAVIAFDNPYSSTSVHYFMSDYVNDGGFNTVSAVGWLLGGQKSASAVDGLDLQPGTAVIRGGRDSLSAYFSVGADASIVPHNLNGASAPGGFFDEQTIHSVPFFPKGASFSNVVPECLPWPPVGVTGTSPGGGGSGGFQICIGSTTNTATPIGAGAAGGVRLTW